MSDCEMAKCYTREEPKARKIHRCCECRGAIQIGEIYVKHSGIWDRPGSFRVCVDCESLRNDIEKTNGRTWDDPVPFTMLHEEVFESRDNALIARYVDIKRKRGAEIQPWMTRMLNVKA